MYNYRPRFRKEGFSIYASCHNIQKNTLRNPIKPPKKKERRYIPKRGVELSIRFKNLHYVLYRSVYSFRELAYGR